MLPKGIPQGGPLQRGRISPKAGEQARGDHCEAATGGRSHVAGSERERCGSLDRGDGGDLLPLAQEFGGLKIDQVKRLKDLETENTRLRRAVSDLTLDKLILQEAARGNF